MQLINILRKNKIWWLLLFIISKFGKVGASIVESLQTIDTHVLNFRLWITGKVTSLVYEWIIPQTGQKKQQTINQSIKSINQSLKPNLQYFITFMCNVLSAQYLMMTPLINYDSYYTNLVQYVVWGIARTVVMRRHLNETVGFTEVHSAEWG